MPAALDVESKVDRVPTQTNFSMITTRDRAGRPRRPARKQAGIRPAGRAAAALAGRKLTGQRG